MKSGQGPRTEVEVDPAQVALAERLSKDLVDCDPAILSLIVVDSLGRVLHVGRSARLPESEQVSPELVRVFGTVSKLIVGAANNAAQVMGGTEAIVGIFKKQKALLINLPGVQPPAGASASPVGERGVRLRQDRRPSGHARRAVASPCPAGRQFERGRGRLAIMYWKSIKTLYILQRSKLRI